MALECCHSYDGEIAGAVGDDLGWFFFSLRAMDGQIGI